MVEIFVNNFTFFGYGIATTLLLAIIGTVGGLVFGILLGLGRTLKISSRDSMFSKILKKGINGFCYVYIWVFRGTPMMIQGLIFFFGLSAMGVDWYTMSSDPVLNGIFICSIIVIVLNTSAYIGEIIRGGIESIDKGQGEAARSLGMTYWQSMFKIVLPQAIKNSLPSIGNEFIVNIKDSSVLNVIGLADLFYYADIIKLETYNVVECYVIVAIIYLVLTLFFTIVFKLIEKKMGGQKVFKLNLFKHGNAYMGDE